MKSLVIPGAAAVVAILAGCGTAAPSAGSTPPAPSGSGTSAAAATSAPPSCHEQYLAWKTGPAKAVADKQLQPALRKVEAAGSDEDLPLLQSSLEAAGRVAVKLEAYPVPPCADPKGYYAQMLGLLRAAGDNASTSSGLSALILAEAPLQKVPAVENKLTAELKKNAGVS